VSRGVTSARTPGGTQSRRETSFQSNRCHGEVSPSLAGWHRGEKADIHNSRVPNRYRYTMPVAFAGLMIGCTLHRSELAGPGPPPTGDIRDSEDITTASWYGPRFHGHRTASGETFDQYGLSAASPSLPLGTRVRVTNLDNGDAVQLRITDRGPYVSGRRLDVSYGAARRLGMVAQGTSRVRIEVVDRPAARLAIRGTHARRDRSGSRRGPGTSRHG
jgi:rare lipoprotein A